MWAKNLFDIFMAFFKSGLLCFGGGPASIPLMRAEIVDNYGWFTNEQFGDALAAGNALPGPIAPKMAAYTGYNVGGIPGAIVGVVASVVPTAILIVLLAKLLIMYKDEPRVKGMLAVAKPIVVVLLLHAAMQFMTKQSFPAYPMFIIAIAAFALVVFLDINPAIVMISGLAIGFMFPEYILPK